ncbi:MAG: DsbA family protein [Patescibacteria group bacterium]
MATSAKTAKAIKLPSIKIPKINLNLQNFFEDSKAYTPILLVLLLVSSFLLGALTTKLSMSSQTGKTDSGDQAVPAAPNVPNQPAPGTKVDVEIGHLPVLGDKNAKVEVIEFSDFQCPFCKQWADQTKDQLFKDYVDTGKIKFAYRQYPIAQLHPNAEKASEASECANDQDKFWDYHDLLFKEQTAWANLPDPTSQFSTYATQVGLDKGAFESCMSSGKFKDVVAKDLQDGGAAGVNGTPTFFINGVSLVGAQPYDAFKTAIDAELAK